MLAKKNLCIFLVPLLLLGCKQAPPTNARLSKQARTQYLQQLQSWQATGRIAINNTQENINASFTWHQQQDKFHIYFHSPFSTQTVTVSGDLLQVNIVSNDGQMDQDLELEQQLPFKQMAWWIKGLPADKSAANAQYDAYNQLSHLEQDGWIIAYQSYSDSKQVSMPQKLSISNGTLKAKILIKNWQK